MAGIEDQIRDSLRRRAEDVEPTPALWAEVDRRIARRRRRAVVSWSLAAATVAVAAVLVVPGIVGGSGPGDLEIEPIGPVTGTVPPLAVVADAGDVSLVDLRGESEPTRLFDGDGEVVQLEVRPGSTADDYDVAAIRLGTDDVAEVLLARSVDGVPGAVEGRLEVHAVAPGFVPSVAWAPQGRTLLYTVPDEADGARLVAEDMASADGTYLDPTRGAAIATIEDGATLLDWVGEVTAPGDTSQVVVRGADGAVDMLEVTIDAEGRLPDGVEPTSSTTWSGVTTALDVAAAHARAGLGSDPFFVLDQPEGELRLTWSADVDAPRLDVPLPEGVDADGAPDGMWLAARGDAALLGDGDRVWLLAHDGSGTFVETTQVASGVGVGALFDVRRTDAADAPTLDDEPGTDADADPGTDPETDPGDPGTGSVDDPGSDGGATLDGQGGTITLPEPIVTVNERELVLIGPDGPEVLATLAPEGESRFIAARVRPGSTPEDLTVAALTSAEGLFDLRQVRYVDGELSTFEAFAPPYVPGLGGTAGAGVSVWGPVWSPDGRYLAWFEFGSGPATLRTVGWDDGPGTGDPATDNASFELPDLGVDPLVPMEWVALAGDEGRTEIRTTWADANDGWFSVPLTIQEDGAVTLGTPGLVSRSRPAGVVGSTGAVLGTEGSDEVAWMVQLTSEGAELLRDPYGTPASTPLPDTMLPGEGIPTFFLRAVGDDVLVGSPNTGSMVHVTGDGELTRVNGEVFDADALD